MPLIMVVLLVWWFTGIGSIPVEPRVPGLDERRETEAEEIEITIGEFFEHLSDEEVPPSSNWSRFRGDRFDNISTDPTPLASNWPPSGPPVVWQYTTGEGHAAAAIHNGRVYILDYDEEERADMLRCFSLATGTELWRRWYHVPMRRNHGISRTIPAVTDDFIVTIGPRCHVMCLDPITGDLLWTLDLEKEYGADTPFWYTGQCPLIVDGIAILAAAGDKLLIGVDCATGEVVWETPNDYNVEMSHSSIIPMTLAGKDMFVYNGIGGIVGVSASGADAGELLWIEKEWNPTVMAPSPVQINDNELLVVAGYGTGGGVIRVERDGDGFTAILTERHNPRQGIASEQQTPILTGDYIWTILPNDAGVMRNQMVCYHKDDITTPVWESGRGERFGLGPYIIADDKMFLLKDDGELSLYRFEGSSLTLLDRHQIIDGIDAWGPIAVADGFLILRDSYNLICIDVR